MPRAPSRPARDRATGSTCEACRRDGDVSGEVERDMSGQRSILITGASTGIGAGCAVGLAQRGYRVFAGVRKPEDGERLVQQAGAGLVPVLIDVTRGDTIDAARKQLEADLGDAGLDGLFNNAGVSVASPIEFLSLDDLRWQLEVNVVGQVAVTQAFLPLLRRARGRIITTGSVGGFVASPFLGAYSMSKFAMEAFSDALRMELKPQGIEVVLIEPAAIASEIWNKGEAASAHFTSDPPPGFLERYGDFLEGVQKFAAEGRERGHPPQVVLDAVIDALESRKPRTRYVMGDGARLRQILRRLPDRLRDRVMLGVLGVKS
jgi:NAD(P)-dependent dehydrogenase (short-subunit alcohol dehydrogenase family)